MDPSFICNEAKKKLNAYKNNLGFKFGWNAGPLVSTHRICLRETKHFSFFKMDLKFMTSDISSLSLLAIISYPV